MKVLCKKAKVFSFSSFEAFRATIMNSQNVLIGSIQKISGKENGRTTTTYLHAVGDYEYEAMAKSEKARNKSYTKKEG